jgi:hypothetical protein
VVRHVRLWAPPSPARVIQRAGEGGSHADTTTRAARPPADEMGATAAATRAGAGSFWSGTHLAARGCRSLPRSRSPTTFPRHRPNSRGCRPGRSPPRRCRVTVPPLRSNIPPAASHSRSLGDAAKAGAAPKRHTTVIAVVARARFMSVPPLGGRPPTTRARAGDALAGERLQVLSRRSSSPPAAACLSGACRHEAPAAASPLTRVINARSRGHLAATTHGVESRRLQPHYPWVGMRHAPRSPA